MVREKIVQWLARLLGVSNATPASPGETTAPESGPLIIYPYNAPTDERMYLAAWNAAMKTDWGKILATFYSQNYARELMKRCPPNLPTAERAVWLAGQDAKKEVYGALLTAATKNIKLKIKPAVDGKTDAVS
jgi:hypothetical protein